MIDLPDITGLVLAGGRGARMGGVDKGLQPFRGQPLALHALQRLRPQVGPTLINANRNTPAYAAFGAPVWPDVEADYSGPLAGFMSGLAHCATPWLVTVPCDVPLFPTDLVARLAKSAHAAGAELAMASAREEDGRLRPQPVFCLMQRALLPSLQHFMAAGGRKIDAWTTQQRHVSVPFDRPDDDPRAFHNANTLDELHRLEQA